MTDFTNQDATPSTTTDDTATQRWLAEALRVCKAACNGNLEQRMTQIDCVGQLAELMHTINDILDLNDAFVREATASLEHAGSGRFFRRVLPNGLQGAYRRAANTINDATQTMQTKTSDLVAAEGRRRRLADEFQTTVEVVNGLTAASKQIESFSKVIDSVANQTKLLALNATIEAARVGEAGKGFAVVADEVKRLAQQTGEATRQIEQQIKAIAKASKETSVAIEKVRVTLANEAGGTAAAGPKLAKAA